MIDSSDRSARLAAALYALAIVGLLAALLLGFVRFTALHQEFLHENMDSVHGARTLLKARYHLGQARERLARAADATQTRQQHVREAAAALELAASYGAEGRDAEPQVRSALVGRITTLHEAVRDVERGESPADALAGLADATQEVADDLEAAELERWGNLAALNQRLGERMGGLHLTIVVGLLAAALLLAGLTWALRRARRAERAMRAAHAAAERMQQATLDAAPLGMAYIDFSAPDAPRFLRVNGQMAAIFGHLSEQLVGMSLAEVYRDPRSLAADMAQLLPALRRGEVIHFDAPMRRRDGRALWVAVSAKAVDAADPTRAMVWSFDDASARKANETDLQAAREAAEADSRAKATLLASIGAAIVSRVAGVHSRLGALECAGLDQHGRRQLEAGRAEAQQLWSLADSVTDLACLTADKFSLAIAPFALRTWLDEIVRDKRAAAAAKGLGFTLNLSGPLPDRVLGDRQRLRQIVDKMLDNALRYTERGRVDLTVSGQSSGAQAWRLRIEVRDTGVGIGAAAQALSFDDAPPASGSAGLGLVVCRELAARMNGRLGGQSLPGIGSVFWFEASFTCEAAEAA